MGITVEEGEIISVGVRRKPFRTVVIKGDPLYDGTVLLKISGARYMSLCWACNGTGYRPGYEFSDSGRCWPCGHTGVHKVIGQGTLEELVKALIQRAKARARYAEKKKREAEEKQAAHAQWLAARPEVRALMETVTGQPDKRWDALLLDLVAQAGHRVLSDAQLDLVVKLYDQDRTWQAAVSERRWLGHVKDKITVTGTLVFTKIYENAYGYSTLYTVNTADGNQASWWRTGSHVEQRGAKVTLKGTIKALNDDPKHGKQTVLTRCKIEYAE